MTQTKIRNWKSKKSCLENVERLWLYGNGSDNTGKSQIGTWDIITMILKKRGVKMTEKLLFPLSKVKKHQSCHNSYCVHPNI